MGEQFLTGPQYFFNPGIFSEHAKSFVSGSMIFNKIIYYSKFYRDFVLFLKVVLIDIKIVFSFIDNWQFSNNWNHLSHSLWGVFTSFLAKTPELDMFIRSFVIKLCIKSWHYRTIKKGKKKQNFNNFCVIFWCEMGQNKGMKNGPYLTGKIALNVCVILLNITIGAIF